MSQTARAKLNIVLSMALFGSIALFVRRIELPSSVIALVRGVVGTAFLLILTAVKKQKMDLAALKGNLLWLILSGAALGFNWILLFEAYRFTTVATATLCYYLAPFLVIMLSPVLLRERLTVKKVLCVLVALMGMVGVSGVLRGAGGAAVGGRGILLGLAAAVLYAAVVLINKQMRGLGAFDRTIFQLGISAAVLLPYCLVTVPVSRLHCDGVGLLLLLVVGVVHTGLTYYLYFGSMVHLKGQTVAIISYVDPVVAILVSVFLLGETMHLSEGIGAVLILGAAFISELKSE